MKIAQIHVPTPRAAQPVIQDFFLSKETVFPRAQTLPTQILTISVNPVLLAVLTVVLQVPVPPVKMGTISHKTVFVQLVA